MNIACVIANGPSRLNFDLYCINATMKTYGCNALYRDFIPDYLISMDLNMVVEIIDNDIHRQTKLYTEHNNRLDQLAEDGEPINFFWGFKETNDSGNSALRLALQQDNDIVYMIGFDYNNGGAGLPNVYSGTANYCRNHMYPAASMKASEWRQRLNKILTEHTDKKIIRVNGNNKPFDMSHSNYSEITTEQFKEIYESGN